MPTILSDRDKLSHAINNSTSYKEVLQFLGLRAAGGNYKQLKHYASKFGLSLPSYNRSEAQKADNNRKKFSDEEIFIKDSPYSNRSHIKTRLKKYKPYLCSECGLGPEWNSKALVLQLDHINGVFNDHRISNLRFLCPNCHSQTETFCGKNS